MRERSLDQRLDAIEATLQRLERLAEMRTADAVSIQEAAKRLSIHPNTVQRMVRDGRLQSRRIGRRRVVPTAALTNFVRQSR